MGSVARVCINYKRVSVITNYNCARNFVVRTQILYAGLADNKYCENWIWPEYCSDFSWLEFGIFCWLDPFIFSVVFTISCLKRFAVLFATLQLADITCALSVNGLSTLSAGNLTSWMMKDMDNASGAQNLERVRSLKYYQGPRPRDQFPQT